jgi:protein-tyrosine kinase
MSRNFELLQNLGKEQVMLDPLVPTEPSIPEPLLVSEPQLKLEPGEQEQLTKLVQRAFLLPGAEAPRVVVFTASESGNGCSWVCARVAETLAAQVTGAVCLVDANLRNPGLHRQFGVENHHGLADALRGRDPIRSFARSWSRPNLWLISCGSSPETCVPALGSELMRQKLAELRSEAAYVLVDAAGMNVSNDAVALGSAADGVVVVLKANSSRRQTARKAVQDMQAANVRIVGAVLNQRTFPIPESIYNRL